MMRSIRDLNSRSSFIAELILLEPEDALVDVIGGARGRRPRRKPQRRHKRRLLASQPIDHLDRVVHLRDALGALSRDRAHLQLTRATQKWLQCERRETVRGERAAFPLHEALLRFRELHAQLEN